MAYLHGEYIQAPSSTPRLQVVVGRGRGAGGRLVARTRPPWANKTATTTHVKVQALGYFQRLVQAAWA